MDDLDYVIGDVDVGIVGGLVVIVVGVGMYD